MRWRDPRERSIPGRPGFVIAELLVVIILIAILFAFIEPAAAKWMRRSEDLAACSVVRQVFALARLEAVRTSANIVLEISSAEGRVRLKIFQDRANDATTPLPADELMAAGNGVQDTASFASSPATDEPTLADVSLSSRIHFWKHGGAMDDVADAVHFDTYGGKATLTDRILFLPSGGIVPPEDAESGPPTASGGRGVYFADWQGKNFFRIGVESDFSCKGRLEKYLDGKGYVLDGWAWQ